MKSLNRIIKEEKFKNLIFDLGFYLVIFILSWTFDKWFEMFTYVVTFTVIRCEFTKAVHGKDFTESYSKGIKYCRYITFGVQVISLIFLINIDISKYVNLILAFVLGIINFFAKDYLEYVILVKHYENKIKEFNSKPLENMSIEEMKKIMPGIKYDRLEIVYNFLHKPKEMRLDLFLDKNYISKATLYRYISEVQEKYKEFQRDN